MSIYYLFWSCKSFIDPICCSILLGFPHISKVGFVHPKFSLRDINATLGHLPSRRHVMWRGSVSVGVHVRALKQSEGYFSAELLCLLCCNDEPQEW